MYANTGQVKDVAVSARRTQSSVRNYARKVISAYRNRGVPLPDSFADRYKHLVGTLGDPNPIVINDAELGIMPFSARPAHYRYEIQQGLGLVTNIKGVHIDTKSPKAHIAERLARAQPLKAAAIAGDNAAWEQLWQASGRDLPVRKLSTVRENSSKTVGWPRVKPQISAMLAEIERARGVPGAGNSTQGQPSTQFPGATPALPPATPTYDPGNRPQNADITGGGDILTQGVNAIKDTVSNILGGGGGGSKPNAPAGPATDDGTSPPPTDKKNPIPMLAIASIGLYLLSQKR